MTFKRNYNKYLVLKQSDIREFLPLRMRMELDRCLDTIQRCREALGKKSNSYVVVNEDEPYAEAVWSLVRIGVETPGKLDVILHYVQLELDLVELDNLG